VFGDETPALRELHRSILDMLSVTDSFVLVEPRLRHLPGWRHTWRSFERQRHETDQLIAAAIHARRTDCGCIGSTGNVLDDLLRAHNSDGSPLSDRQIRDHLMSVILAGHETTAAELAWAFQLLAHNPTVQHTLIEEIAGSGSDARPGPNSSSDSSSGSGAGHEYLTATVQEVLRHRPVFPFTIPRVVVAPIEIGGYTYRPPAQLLGCIYLMHHDPALYPDPHEFRPERFLGSAPSSRVWLPWGGGRKRCPGHHLATLEMHTVLHAVLSTRTVLPAGGMERARWRSVIVTPHAGSRIVLRTRTS
jgi:cytochrome P450